MTSSTAYLTVSAVDSNLAVRISCFCWLSYEQASTGNDSSDHEPSYLTYRI
ncbi:MAG: hypothetical protein N3E45_01725 [Oscillatoriaceae bacterium SKW80]|nr:hypothetical protein [Oscillatoriaceae bacterium SKW80]HIK28209.1 hypothetical protein [Oscillatoriaceae cyanobacterium M7585_C2015_266]